VDALILGATIGLAAGISPGPLLFLTITSALRSGARAGVIVACAPLLWIHAWIARTALVVNLTAALTQLARGGARDG